MKRTLNILKKKLIVMTFLIPLLSGSSTGWAQFTYSICQDKPNNGQLKRMVFIKWDDWKPTTNTFLGIPLNARGFVFWKILNKKYYEGDDLRPYRLDGGPFIKNYADLSLQQTSDKKIMDSTEVIRNTSMATYLNMSGGSADMPYNLYFKRKFEDIYKAFDEWVYGMKSESSKAYEACIKSNHFKTFLEYLDITKDRVQAIHESFVDKGVRIEAYMNIYKELSKKYDVISQYMAGQVRLSKMPTPARLKEIKDIPVHANDKAIVNHILSTFKF